MNKFKVTLEFNGGKYSGWQMQPGCKTIQGILLDAAKQIFPGSPIEIYGSGRTDKGVHALGQVAHLAVNGKMSLEILRLKWNDLLPSDINILTVESAHKDFHARHDAVARSYIYQISRRRNAFGKDYTWWIKDQLNINTMRDCAKVFEGTHDFASFTDKNIEKSETRVRVEKLELYEFGSVILIHFKASHFLWKMVRRVVGILAEAGRGNIKPADIEFLLKTRSDAPAKFTAPPSGLFLQKVYFNDTEEDTEIQPLFNFS